MRILFAAFFAALFISQASAQSSVFPQNFIYAGPTSGSGFPKPRALVGADLPAPSVSTLGGIESLTCSAHQWLNNISTAGVPACSQPAFTDVSGAATLAQLPSANGNTVLSNWTNGSASPSYNVWPACANDGSHALVYVNGTGLQCESLSTGGTVTSATIAGAGGVAATGTCTITTTGTCTLTGTTKQVWSFSSGGQSPGAGVTEYIGHAQIFASGTGASRSGVPSPFSGTLKNLYINMTADPGNTQTFAFTVFVAGSSTSIACTVTGNGSTGFTCNDTSHTAAVSAGNLIAIQVITSGGAATNLFPQASLEFDNSN